MGLVECDDNTYMTCVKNTVLSLALAATWMMPMFVPIFERAKTTHERHSLAEGDEHDDSQDDQDHDDHEPCILCFCGARQERSLGRLGSRGVCLSCCLFELCFQIGALTHFHRQRTDLVMQGVCSRSCMVW
jgi:hypothetical protein